VRVRNNDGRNAAVTMQDVAKAAGVSATAVSYVLNNVPTARISAATRLRVLDAAAQLNYRPNAIARAMASGRTLTIGVYGPHTAEALLGNPWSGEALHGIAEELRRWQFHLLLYGFSDPDSHDVSAFTDGRVDGLVVLAPYVDDALPARLVAAGFPTAIVGSRAFGGPRMVWVDMDNVGGARLATKHLLRLGHRRIAHLRGPLGSSDASDRQAGYEAAMREAGVEIPPGYVMEAGYGEREGRNAARELLKVKPRPTAVFTANDMVALGTMQVCEDMGLHVPADVAVVGFDDMPVCEFTRPRLTSIRQPMQEMGRVAASMLLTMVTKGTRPPRSSRVIPAKLVVRETCGAQADSGPLFRPLYHP
jgi:DNA-binding LacI/PurR family transcriptional regulator